MSANYRILVDIPKESCFTELLEVVKVHSGTGMCLSSPFIIRVTAPTDKDQLQRLTTCKDIPVKNVHSLLYKVEIQEYSKSTKYTAKLVLN